MEDTYVLPWIAIVVTVICMVVVGIALGIWIHHHLKKG